MATKPATAPEAAPTMVGLPVKIHSHVAQLMAAAAVAVLVTTKALVANAPAETAEPALKPNQPNHNKEAPIITYGTLCMPGLSVPMRLPKNKAVTNPAKPAFICTTVPPAKSNAPQVCPAKPSDDQTMWQMGQYTKVS